MGQVRNIDFDAVIGIGGIGGEAKSAGISGKVNWIGLRAYKEPIVRGRGPLVKFEHFILFDDKGKDFRKIAPILSQHIYSRNVRFLVNFNREEQLEINRILEMAEIAPPSTDPPLPRVVTRCTRCCHNALDKSEQNTIYFL
jgi:hypothetical protein